MRVLIVEDDENKRNQLCRFLSDEYPEANQCIAKSMHSALRQIRHQPPDLVLLDMTLPNYDLGPDEAGGQTRMFGGRDVLRQLDRFKVVVPVIVVTQFEQFSKHYQRIGLGDLHSQLSTDHKRTYLGAVYYHAAIHDWKDDLRKLIEAASKRPGIPTDD